MSNNRMSEIIDDRSNMIPSASPVPSFPSLMTTRGGDDPTTAAIATRAAAEVQAAMAIAKRYPRDQNLSFQRIMQACQRQSLAEVACYSYAKGGTAITGPSIRLMEVVAQQWGNIDFGIHELEQTAGESTMMAVAVDLETNTRSYKVFKIKHAIKTRSGTRRIDADDSREVYEHVANFAARRLRACLEAVIPRDVIEAAVEQTQRTLAKGGGKPIEDRIRDMVRYYSDQLQVTVPMLESYLGHKVGACSEQELVRLRNLATSIRDGMTTREEAFKLKAIDEPATTPAPKGNGQAKADKEGGLADHLASEAQLQPDSKPQPAVTPPTPNGNGRQGEAKQTEPRQSKQPPRRRTRASSINAALGTATAPTQAQQPGPSVDAPEQDEDLSEEFEAENPIDNTPPEPKRNGGELFN
jgi:hypothetical protein